jgi:hypothetical protein
MRSPSLDQLRLLYIVNRFTRMNGVRTGRRWMKELPLSILVYHGIQSEVFSDYDWAPSLVEFHGVKMYGKVSQEAHADLKKLQGDRLVEKLHLSTYLYDSIRAYRTTPCAETALEVLAADDRVALNALLQCSQCGALQEVLAYVERDRKRWSQVRNSAAAYCTACCRVRRGTDGPVIEANHDAARIAIDFFDIAEISYRTRPSTLGGFR